MVERHLAKVNVAGSSLVSRSIFDLTSAGFGRRFFFDFAQNNDEKFGTVAYFQKIFIKNIQKIKNVLPKMCCAP